jgi:CheY-like chemotaxis protein
MDDARNAWRPIVAEREKSLTAGPAESYPCRGPYNRYLGCVGARKCRAAGVAKCVLGRWPDERSAPSRAVAIDPPAPRQSAASAADRSRLAGSPVATPPSPAPAPPTTIGVVHVERRAWRQISRELSHNGYEPVWYDSGAAAVQALEHPERPSALLVDSRLATDGGDTLLSVASNIDVPVLLLPAAGATGELEATTRMATVWLAVNLRPAS